MSPAVLPPNFQLTRLPSGRLRFTSAQGEVHDGVSPVRAFPLTAPNEGISLVSAEGKELAWITQWPSLPAEMQALLHDELALRDFVPEITQVKSVSSFGTPSVWSVETDRGPTQLVLHGEEDIRRLEGSALLIAAGDGVHYSIADMRALDMASRRLLERFL